MLSWCSLAGCVRLHRVEEVNTREEDSRSAPWISRLAKDLFVSICDALLFRGFQEIMWQEGKGEDMSQVLGT